MTDESSKISIQIPAETIKELSTLTDEAKSRLDARGFVTLQGSPDTLAKLTALRQDIEQLQKSFISEWHIENEKLTKTSEWRISFHEKLILLAGGSFALSLTFLGALQNGIAHGASFFRNGQTERGLGTFAALYCF